MNLDVFANAVSNIGLFSLIVSVSCTIVIKEIYSNKKCILIFCGINYFIFIFWLTIFSRDFNIYPRKITIVFYFLKSDWYSILQIIQNILLFVPLGAILGCGNASFLKTVKYSCLLTFSIETLQLVLACGTFQVDDLIVNNVGGIMGYGIIWMSKMLYKLKLAKPLGRYMNE